MAAPPPTRIAWAQPTPPVSTGSERHKPDKALRSDMFMKKFVTTVCLLVCGLASAFAADSVVVFNEIHYHPVTNETASEWVELHNQMAVDIDLSAWSLTGSIGFTFTEGTIIPGGGYLVIASNPGTLQT